MVNDTRVEKITTKIKTELGDIYSLLNDPAVIDIMYNPDGSLWTERFGRGKCLEPIDYPKDKAALVIRSIASFNGLSVSEDEPLLSAPLPTGQRFQGFIYPAVDSPAFSIRCNRTINITLDDYVPDSLSYENKQMLHKALAEKNNIILSGGTGSGKTTFCSALLDELYKIAPDDRIALMEDTPEMQLKHKNIICERKTPKCSYTALLRANLRANPDRIILGECRGGEAYDLLKSWNTGHPGGLTTLHANSATAALTRLESLIFESEDAKNMNILAVRSNIAEAVNIVVQIERKCGQAPRISQIVKIAPTLNTDGTYICEELMI